MKNYSATSLQEDKNMCCVSIPSFNELLKKMPHSIFNHYFKSNKTIIQAAVFILIFP